MPDTAWFPILRTTFADQPRNPRRKVAVTVTALAFVLILLVPQTSSGSGCPGGGKIQTNISVTTYISDFDSNGLQSAVASDGLGAYSDGVNGVTSILTVNGYNCIKWGDWQFGTYSSTVRAVTQGLLTADAVQPGDPHYQSPANPPFWGTELHESHIEVKCTLINNDMLTMTAGSSFTCPLIDRFHASGTDYRLLPAYSATGYPETTDVQVRCNTADSGGCNDWFIDPFGAALGTEAVGRLVQPPPKPNGQPIDDGDFYMRFHIHVTRH